MEPEVEAARQNVEACQHSPQAGAKQRVESAWRNVES